MDKRGKVKKRQEEITTVVHLKVFGKVGKGD